MLGLTRWHQVDWRGQGIPEGSTYSVGVMAVRSSHCRRYGRRGRKGQTGLRQTGLGHAPVITIHASRSSGGVPVLLVRPACSGGGVPAVVFLRWCSGSGDPVLEIRSFWSGSCDAVLVIRWVSQWVCSSGRSDSLVVWTGYKRTGDPFNQTMRKVSDCLVCLCCVVQCCVCVDWCSSVEFVD